MTPLRVGPKTDAVLGCQRSVQGRARVPEGYLTAVSPVADDALRGVVLRSASLSFTDGERCVSRRHRSTSHCNASAYGILADAPRSAVARVALAPYTSGRHGRLPNVPRMSRAETTPPQQAGAPARVSRQGGGRFGRQLLAPRSGPNQLLHLRQSWNCVSVPPPCNVQRSDDLRHRMNPCLRLVVIILDRYLPVSDPRAHTSESSRSCPESQQKGITRQAPWSRLHDPGSVRPPS